MEQNRAEQNVVEQNKSDKHYKRIIMQLNNWKRTAQNAIVQNRMEKNIIGRNLILQKEI